MSDRNLNPRPSQLDKAAFVAAYGEIYEHSPWVAELAWEKGLSATQDTPAGLAEAMGEVLSSAPAERQLEVIRAHPRSEEHTSELQSRPHLVCRLLLEKKNKYSNR